MLTIHWSTLKGRGEPSSARSLEESLLQQAGQLIRAPAPNELTVFMELSREHFVWVGR